MNKRPGKKMEKFNKHPRRLLESLWYPAQEFEERNPYFRLETSTAMRYKKFLYPCQILNDSIGCSADALQTIFNRRRR